MRKYIIIALNVLPGGWCLLGAIGAYLLVRKYLQRKHLRKS